MKQHTILAVAALTVLTGPFAHGYAQNHEDGQLDDPLDLRLHLITSIDAATARKDVSMLALLEAAAREVDTIHAKLNDSSLSRELSDLGLSESPLATNDLDRRLDHLIDRLRHPVAVAHALNMLGLGEDPTAARFDVEAQVAADLHRLDELLRLFDEDPARATAYVSRVWSTDLTETEAHEQVASIRSEGEDVQNLLRTDPALVSDVLSRHLERTPTLTAKILSHNGTQRDSTMVEESGLASVSGEFGIDFIGCLMCTMAQAFRDVGCENEYGMCMIDAGSFRDTMPIPDDASEELRELREELLRARVEMAEMRCQMSFDRCRQQSAERARLCCLLAAAIPV